MNMKNLAAKEDDIFEKVKLIITKITVSSKIEMTYL